MMVLGAVDLSHLQIDPKSYQGLITQKIKLIEAVYLLLVTMLGNYRIGGEIFNLMQTERVFLWLGYGVENRIRKVVFISIFWFLLKKKFLENDKLIKIITKNQTKGLLGKYKATKNDIFRNKNTTLDKLFFENFGHTNRFCKTDVLTEGSKSQNILNYITKYIMKTLDLCDHNGTTIDNDNPQLNGASFHCSLWGYRVCGFFCFS